MSRGSASGHCGIFATREDLLTTARNFLAQATEHEALFLELELPADSPAQLGFAITNLETADVAQTAGLSGQVGGTALPRSELTRGIKARNLLLPIVRNKFRGNAGVLAQWDTASRVVRPQRASKKTAPPTVP